MQMSSKADVNFEGSPIVRANDEGLTPESSASDTLYVGEFALSTLLIKIFF